MSSIPLTSLKKDLTLILGQLELLVATGDLQVTSIFLVADTLAVDIMLNTEFCNQHILGIPRNELKVKPRSSRPIAILSSYSITVNYTVTTDNFNTMQVTARNAAVKCAKEVRLKPGTVTPVAAVFNARDLLRFETNMALVLRQLLPASGFMEVMPSRPFCMLQTNVSSQHFHVTKHMIVGQLCYNVIIIVDLNQLLPAPTEDSTLAAAVSTDHSDDEYMTSSKGANTQALDD